MIRVLTFIGRTRRARLMNVNSMSWPTEARLISEFVLHTCVALKHGLDAMYLGSRDITLKLDAIKNIRRGARIQRDEIRRKNSGVNVYRISSPGE